MISKRRYAIAAIRDVLAAEVGDGPVNLHRRVEIRDVVGALLMCVFFWEAII
jgi:hypothetical protein